MLGISYRRGHHELEFTKFSMDVPNTIENWLLFPVAAMNGIGCIQFCLAVSKSHMTTERSLPLRAFGRATPFASRRAAMCMCACFLFDPMDVLETCLEKIWLPFLTERRPSDRP